MCLRYYIRRWVGYPPISPQLCLDLSEKITKIGRFLRKYRTKAVKVCLSPQSPSSQFQPSSPRPQIPRSKSNQSQIRGFGCFSNCLSLVDDEGQLDPEPVDAYPGAHAEDHDEDVQAEVPVTAALQPGAAGSVGGGSAVGGSFRLRRHRSSSIEIEIEFVLTVDCPIRFNVFKLIYFLEKFTRLLRPAAPFSLAPKKAFSFLIRRHTMVDFLLNLMVKIETMLESNYSFLCTAEAPLLRTSLLA